MTRELLETLEIVGETKDILACMERNIMDAIQGVMPDVAVIDALTACSELSANTSVLLAKITKTLVGSR